MTERVDFYVMPGTDPGQRLAFACRLTEKAYLRDLRVVVLAEDAVELRELDDLLWTFSDRAFVPHRVWPAGEAPDAATPVHLALSLPDATEAPAELLINLSRRLPPAPARFARIAEIIDADAERRSLGRERFKAYRDLQMPLETHQLDES
jgi:DNA polymerase-3 subunit chi